MLNISDDIISHATNQNEHLKKIRKVFDKMLDLQKAENFVNYVI